MMYPPGDKGDAKPYDIWRNCAAFLSAQRHPDGNRRYSLPMSGSRLTANSPRLIVPPRNRCHCSKTPAAIRCSLWPSRWAVPPLRQVREWPWYSVTRTAISVASDRWASSLGVAGLVRKPFEATVLLAEMRRCLGA